MDRLRRWLGLERNIVVMLVVVVVIGMGEELWSRFIPKYLEAFGASVFVISCYGVLKDFLDSFYAYPGGWITDRLGGRRALILFTIIAIFGYVVYLFAPSWELILAGTVLVMAWASLTLPAIFSIIGDSLPKEKRTMGFSMHSILRRVPRTAAPLIGGILVVSFGIAAGIKMGLLVTIVLAFAAIIIISKFYKESGPAKNDGMGYREVWKRMSPRLRLLLLSDCFIRWAEGIPNVFIVLYVLNILKMSEFHFGAFTAIQMLTSMILYIPIAHIADHANRKPFVAATFAFFALFPLALVNASGILLVSAAFVVGGLREIGEPARKALITDLAGAETRGRTVGLYYFIRGFVVFPASLVGGWLWAKNPEFPFYAAFAIGCVGFLIYVVCGKEE